MRIALIGYGRMGHAIEEIALNRGHDISLRIHADNAGEFTPESLSGTDVAIEFTGPESAADNIGRCLEWSVPVVSGSTGWLARWDEVKDLCDKQAGALLYASNFSIGVNLFFGLNKYLAGLMARHPEYRPELEEIHHTGKKDAPSGTAITLAEQMLAYLRGKTGWEAVESGNETPGDRIAVRSKRIDPAPGTHIISYRSDIDDIQIMHTAHSRKGFAMGAVLAAEFLKGRTGIFSMNEVLGLDRRPTEV